MKEAREWQKDPLRVNTEKVQLWHNGIMLTVITKEEARKMVKEGKAYVVLTGQSIESIPQKRKNRNKCR